VATGKKTRTTVPIVRKAGWVGAALAGLALVGLIVAPSAKLVWIAMLVFAIAAVPQAYLLSRRNERPDRERRRP
jgi:hypothetical protein